MSAALTGAWSPTGWTWPIESEFTTLFFFLLPLFVLLAPISNRSSMPGRVCCPDKIKGGRKTAFWGLRFFFPFEKKIYGGIRCSRTHMRSYGTYLLRVYVHIFCIYIRIHLFYSILFDRKENGQGFFIWRAKDRIYTCTYRPPGAAAKKKEFFFFLRIHSTWFRA